MNSSAPPADPARVIILAPTDPARPQPSDWPADPEADSSESEVLAAYQAHLARSGHVVQRHRVLFRDPMPSTDLFDATANELVMALHRTFYRSRIRALGVLLDCAKSFPGSSNVLLLTTRPGPPVLAFLAWHNITAVWPAGETFERSTPRSAEPDQP